MRKCSWRGKQHELQQLLEETEIKDDDRPSTPEEELQEIPEDTRSKDEILQGCRKAIWARLDRITKALIAQTLKKGSYLHARFLFDLVGVSREEREPREDGSLVELLLEKFEAPQKNEGVILSEGGAPALSPAGETRVEGSGFPPSQSTDRS